MTEEEIKGLYTLSDGTVDVTMERRVNDVSIKSRLKYVDDAQAIKIAKFLLGYCSKDTSEPYGGYVVDMFRVLDALEMIRQNEIEYRDAN